MHKIIVVIVCFILFISCNNKSKIEEKINEKPNVKLQVERFDQLFFETPPEKLVELKKRYPAFFPANVPDNVWIDKMKNPLWRELYKEVQKKYKNLDPVTNEIEDLFKHINYYFPKTKKPKIVALIYEVDYNTKAIYNDSLLILSLEMYLGKKHKFYEDPEYIKQNFERNQILPDIVSSFYQYKAPRPQNKTFLEEMIYAGKELYLKDLLIPNYSDADKIGYTPEQIKWCEENESYMWRYFIEGNLLYDNDIRLANRFINRAPFSKFYLEIDNESPGRVGTWVGWQMVRSFAKNNTVPLEKLLAMNAEELFNLSKYKPKKND
jgi:gliding motility-associated lipoprotein GldB